MMHPDKKSTAAPYKHYLLQHARDNLNPNAANYLSRPALLKALTRKVSRLKNIDSTIVGLQGPFLAWTS